MSDNDAYRFPVSVKGVVLRDAAVIAVKNRRDEWELPGGKLELGETPESCLEREIAEELGLVVEAADPIDTWVYTIDPTTHVVIVSYGCVERGTPEAVLSDEHTELSWIPLHDVPQLRMPDGYKRTIARWAAQRGAG